MIKIKLDLPDTWAELLAFIKDFNNVEIQKRRFSEEIVISILGAETEIAFNKKGDVDADWGLYVTGGLTPQDIALAILSMCSRKKL